MADKTNSSANYAYDVVGNRAAMVYGDGVTNLYQYDAMNRLTNQVCGNANNAAFATFSYGLGPTGNRLWLLESVNGTGRYYAWNYDNLYRLTNEVIRGATVGNLSYAYDPVGNRTNRTSTISGLNDQVPVYDPDDWMTNSDGYDPDGNTTNSGGNFYQYDVLDHLTNVNSGQIVMTYDGDGTRMSKTVGSTTTYYLVDDQNPSGYSQVLEKWISTGTPTVCEVYNYGLDLISQRTISPQPSTNYFICDGHGSTRALTDIGGTVVNVFAYDTYGNLIASNGVPQTAYLYCGQQWDSELGLYMNRARYLNPNTGRFWTMDTYEGDNEDPLSLHKYLYAADDPVDYDDPSGNDYGDFSINLGTIFLPIAGFLAQAGGGTGLGAFNPVQETQSFFHGPWHVETDGNINLNGAGIGIRATAEADPDGFKVTYNGPTPPHGQAIVYQVIKSDSLVGIPAIVDRGSNGDGSHRPGILLPPAMGLGLPGGTLTSYVDSPGPSSSPVNYWTLTSVAVMRVGNADALLSTVRFQFDNKSRKLVLPLDVGDYNDVGDLRHALRRWGADTGVHP